MQVPSENLDGAGRIDGEELGFGASEAPFELRALEIALDVVRIPPRAAGRLVAGAVLAAHKPDAP